MYILHLARVTVLRVQLAVCEIQLLFAKAIRGGFTIAPYRKGGRN